MICCDTYVEVINAVAAGAPDGMSIGIHICRSQDPSWQADVGYDPIAEAIFNELQAQHSISSNTTMRAPATFEPLRAVPTGKTIVLGLVASKTAELEGADMLKRRIDEASRYVKLDQLALSPQCGFSTSATDRGR